MLIDVKRFLALTTLIAAGSAAASGCIIKSDDDKNDTDAGAGTGGTGGWSGTGGTGGSTGGTGGYAGTGGYSGADGSAGDAATECLGDSRLSDGGLDGICHQLPYAFMDCGGGSNPLPQDACVQLHQTARPGVFDAFLSCVQLIPTSSACNANAFTTCAEQVFGNTCRQPIEIAASTWTASTATCEKMHSRCAALSVDKCESYLSGLTGDDDAGTNGRKAFIDCWDNSSTSSDCDLAFDSCIFLNDPNQ